MSEPQQPSSTATRGWFLGPILTLPSRAGSITSIAYLRGVAVLLVLWDHVVAGWTRSHGRSWLPLDMVRHWVTTPLGIIQDFGFLGVTLFFMLSGYIVSEVAVRETRAVFATKRLLRIFPALIASVLVIVAIDRLRPSLGIARQSFGLAQSLWAMTLLNYVRAAEGPVNGVAWSLVVELVFYALVFSLLPQLRRWPVPTIAFELALIVAVVMTARTFPVEAYRTNWFLLSASMAYIPLLVIGQAVWLWHTGRASVRVSALLGFASWLVFVLGIRRIHVDFLSADNSYGVSAVLALVIFVAFIVNEQRLKLPRWLAAASVLSYSIYLVHGPITELEMDWISPSVPFTLRLLIALVGLAIATCLLWRIVEAPSQAFARWLSRRLKRSYPPMEHLPLPPRTRRALGRAR